MARQQEPQRAAPTVQEMQRGIARLERRIEELTAFEPGSIQSTGAPEILPLETAIEETLEAVFGRNTSAYHRYKPASRLDKTPMLMRSDLVPRRPHDELREKQNGVAKGKEQAIRLLRQAIRGLQETLDGREPAAAANSHTHPAAQAAPIEPALPPASRGLRIEKTVFISYRRTAAPWAQSIFQDLTQHGYDVFFDFQGLTSGGYEEVIFENIKARAHFLVLLTPTALERCTDVTDLFRREIETAIGSQRNIVPVMLDGFDFGATGIEAQLAESLAPLRHYNGLPVYSAYFPEAMEKLRQKYLNVPLYTVLHPVSPAAERLAKDEQAAASNAPPVTTEELRDAELPRYTFVVKVRYQDELEKVEGTRAEEPTGQGSLTIFDGDSVIARYPEIERWSRQKSNV
jgi:hypothetical protein